MTQNLDTLRSEIAAALAASDFAVFYGAERATDPMPTVRWDVDRYPDPRGFLDAARKAGAPILVFQHRQFTARLLEEALEDLEVAELSRDERRDLERSLRKFGDYEGFTCMIELSFFAGGVWYLYLAITPWYDDFLSILDQVHDAVDGGLDEEEDDDRGSLGGYFSKN